MDRRRRNWAELGGNIIDSDRKFGAVFGAKKDNKEVEK